ncbi:MAG TPA: glycosyltransferase 87 family protein [Polyangiaceae bacterium]|jgi:hypothetical protein|nr:MAG: hypothetical protein BWY17_00187 [Deltaproteobacteria bacterium ADurb.Bin207]HNZ22683.1 glycosyltransferase 87 family protein [Polyangiaceae bacterium]HQM08427.1 glycosyltransferase 87 family protein [Polyangiaceae bacterium]
MACFLLLSTRKEGNGARCSKLGSIIRQAGMASKKIRFPTIMRAAIGLLSLIQIANLLHLFRLRVAYPYQLEWMEGAVLEHIERVSTGQSLYVAPSVSFTPYLYTPFYYAVSGAMCRVLGFGLEAPRVVSIVATVATLGFVASFVYEETRDRLAPLVAVALFVSTYEVTGFWFDLARVDSLFHCLVLASLWLARFGKSHGAMAGAGATLFLAFFTKQAALAFLLPLAVFAFATGWKHALNAIASFSVLTVTATLYLQRISEGWFTYYVFRVTGQHKVHWDWLAPSFLEYFIKPYGIALLFTVIVLVIRPRALQRRRLTAAYVLWLLCAVASSALSLNHQDGWVNVLIPAYGALAVVAGFGFGAAQRNRHQSIVVMSIVMWGIAFAVLVYPPSRALPTRADWAAGALVTQALRSAPAPLWMPGAGYLQALAGHEENSAHTMALADIFKTQEPRIRNQLRDDILVSVRQHRWASIVIDPSFRMLPPEIMEEIRRCYRWHQSIFPEHEHGGWPNTGFQTRPQEIWIPR